MVSILYSRIRRCRLTDYNRLKFDDDRVVPATVKEVLEEGYGGEPLHAMGLNGRPNVRAYKRFTNAYMLVYIRECMLDEILEPVTEEDIPPHLIKRIEDERLARERRKKERDEEHLYMKMFIVTDKSFETNYGFDFVQLNEKLLTEESPTRVLRVRREQTYGVFLDELSASMNIPKEHFRLWLLVNRQNRTVRPDAPIPDNEKERALTLEQIAQKYLTDHHQQVLRLYVETVQHFDNDQSVFPPASQVLVFIKLFDPYAQLIR